MMCNLYFRRYKLFNYKYVHIVKPNVLQIDMNNVTFKHTPSKKTGPTDYLSSSYNVCISSRALHGRTELRNWQDKIAKASPKKLYIKEW